MKAGNHLACRMDESYGFRILLVILLIGINGFFAGAEVALISVRPSRLKQLAEEGQAGARAAQSLLANPERLLSVIQVGVTLASLGLGWAGEETVHQILITAAHPLTRYLNEGALHGISFILAFLTITYLHVVLGEVVPKNLAIDKADRLAVAVAPVLLFFARASSGFVAVIERSSTLVSRALRLREEGARGGHSAEELKFIVSASRGMSPVQEDMIHRTLELGKIAVREVMVPRRDIISVPVHADLDQVLKTMIEHQYSRLPVYDDKPEKIIGILHYKDLLPVWQERRTAIRAGRAGRPFRVQRLMRKYIVVPETKPLLQMLEDFSQGGSHMAMVVDEFGTIVGLLTVKDVLEQIVGPIRDEYDEKVTRPPSEAAELELDGALRIRELESEFGIELPGDAGFETLAGFLLYRLGYIPKAGESVEHGGRKFTIIEMDRNRIAKVRVEKLAEQPTPAAEG